MEEQTGVMYGGIRIPSLLLVDDVALISESEVEMNHMLRVLEDFRKRHRLSLSGKKSKIQCAVSTFMACVKERLKNLSMTFD